MNYPWMEEYFLAKKGCVKEWHEAFGVYRFLLENKMVGMWGTDNKETEIITLKIEPLKGEYLRKQFPEDVKPGYYMNKLHWNSVNLNGIVPEDILKDMIDESYQIALLSLSKKNQQKYL